MFIPTTPGSELASRIREKIMENNQGRDWMIKVVETSGRSVKSLLQKADPTPARPCGLETCMSCPHDVLGECTKEGAVYRVHCTHPSCGEEGARYWGELARTLSLRQGEHSRGLEKRKPESPMWGHCAAAHQGEMQAFQMRIVSTHLDPLSRLIKEGVMISQDKSGLRMNSRANFRQPKVTRTIRTRNLGDVVQDGTQTNRVPLQGATPTNDNNSSSQTQDIAPQSQAAAATTAQTSRESSNTAAATTTSQARNNKSRRNNNSSSSNKNHQQQTTAGDNVATAGEPPCSRSSSSNNSNVVGMTHHNRAEVAAASPRGSSSNNSNVVDRTIHNKTDVAAATQRRRSNNSSNVVDVTPHNRTDVAAATPRRHSSSNNSSVKTNTGRCCSSSL